MAWLLLFFSVSICFSFLCSVWEAVLLSITPSHINRKGAHPAIVIDAYGTVVGLVTMGGLFETLLGLEIMDESDIIEDLQRYARKQWEERAKRLGLI